MGLLNMVWLCTMALVNINSANDSIRCSADINCDQAAQSEYRTIDGTCNNVNNPLWGAARTPQPRYQPAQYDDGVGTPRTTAKDESPLPNPRQISNRLFRAEGELTVKDDSRTLMIPAWGQFTDHDITITPFFEGDRKGIPKPCCGADEQISEGCFPLPIPADDPHFTVTCTEFARSVPAPQRDDCITGQREQINELTSFIDGSQVYGSDTTTMNQLVNVFTGEMLTSKKGNLLPPRNGDTTFCVVSDEKDFCQDAGDIRVNDAPFLGGNHLMFVREHNRILKKLKKVQPKWSAWKLYQETRKIVGALLQQITYGEFLPSILREEDLEKFNLKLKSTGYSSSYDNSRNPASKNVFGAAAFRFGHSTLPTSLAYLLKDYMTSTTITPLEMTILDPHMLITKGGKKVSDLTRFIITTTAMKVDNQLEASIRNHMFEALDGVGFDLGAVNMQRGRDHGLPPYNAWRRWCGLPAASSFADMHDMSEENKAAFADLYNDVEDIDVFPGLISEIPQEGAALGPLLSCILGNQFRDFKDGDRYWYENQGKEGFTEAQLAEIRKVSLAKILCENMGVDPVQPNVFRVPSLSNALKKCKTYPEINFSAWKY